MDNMASISDTLEIKFGDAIKGEFSHTLIRDIEFVKINEEKGSQINKGTPLRINKDKDDCDILINTFKCEGRDTGYRPLIHCTDRNDERVKIAVWQFPYNITPKESTPSNGGQAEIKYWYLPDIINTVFLIGENGSGKSLLLSCFARQNRDKILHISSANIVRGFDSINTRSISQKTTDSSPNDGQRIKRLTNDNKTVIKERFKQITENWSLDFVEDDGNTSVYFQRLKSNDIVACVFPYNLVSDGLRLVFEILIDCCNLEKDSIVCLDEPEAHLHPRLYCALVKNIIGYLDPNWSRYPNANQSSAKLIIATHDFHLIDSVARIEKVHGVVMEVSSKPSGNAPKTIPEFKNRIGATNSTDLMNAPLFSDITTTCNSNFVFDRRCKEESLVTYSPFLIECMTDTKSIVLYCEGDDKNGIDKRLYRLLFDPNRVEIRAVGGCEDVRLKTKAAKDGQKVLSAQRTYIGICDRDRNFCKPPQDIVVLPIAEIENMFWIPEFWEDYHQIINLFCDPGRSIETSEFEKRKRQFWHMFRKLINSRTYFYMCEYALASYTEIHRPTNHKLHEFELNMKQKSKDSINDVHDSMMAILNNVKEKEEKFRNSWITVLERARLYSDAWKQKDVQDLFKQEKYEECRKKHLEKLNSILYEKFLIQIDHKDISFKQLYISADKQEINEETFPTQLFLIFTHLGNVNDANDDAFKQYYHLINEKDIYTALGETLFKDKTSNGISQKDRVLNIFERILSQETKFGDDREQKRSSLRTKMLQTLGTLLGKATYPSDETKRTIMDALLK